ncbi:MAG: hypothetical protein MUE44_12360 [Oscillatoriaceae cyanobacterium Prado104]|nr:hypothetical protein [Oscillatoriaceae cyanobacterium Prado104]
MTKGLLTRRKKEEGRRHGRSVAEGMESSLAQFPIPNPQSKIDEIG